MSGGKAGVRWASRCPDVISALAQIRGFSDLPPASSSANDEVHDASFADASLLRSSSFATLSSSDHGLDPYDPLSRLLDEGEPVGHDQEVALLSEYIDAELRAIGVILARASGGAMLAAFHPELGVEPEALRQQIEAACVSLQDSSAVPKPQEVARVLALLSISRRVRARFLEHVSMRIENESALFNGDPAGAAAFRSCYSEVLRLRATLIEANIRFIEWLVVRRRASWLDRRDLRLAGVDGLLRAIMYFDPEYKTRLTTYSQNWIKTHVHRANGALSPVLRSPVHLQDSRRKLQSVRLLLCDELGREPTVTELAERCALTVGKVETVLSSMRTGRSPDLQRTPGGEPIGDVIYDESWPTPAQIQARTALSRLLSDAVAHLAERGNKGLRMQQVLNQRFGLLGDEEMTLQEIGDVFEVSRERIRQIQEIALEELYHRHGSDLARLLPIWLDQVPAMIPTVLTSSDSSAAGGNLL